MRIFRHPVKGLRPEELTQGELATGRGLVGDRGFAFQFLDEAVPADLRSAPEMSAPWMPKGNLLMQHDWPGLAKVVPVWRESSRQLKLSIDGGPSVEASAESAEERARLVAFMQNYLAGLEPYEKARHPQKTPLRLIGSPDLSSRFTDNEKGPVTLATEATFSDLAAKLGHAVDFRRFRLNLILPNGEAWSELKWSGRKLRIGECVLEVQKPLGRCANIDVHPETGERDAVIYQRLKPVFGHALTGIRAEVLRPGVIRAGDDWELFD